MNLENYWISIPIGKENLVSYDQLCDMWKMPNKRAVRLVLQRLSEYDNGDSYVLIRSARNKGFYRSDDREEINRYRTEVLHKGKALFAPIQKCDRLLNIVDGQESIDFNIKFAKLRETWGYTQEQVLKLLAEKGVEVDKPLLSKIENGVCFPNYDTYKAMLSIYGVYPKYSRDIS